MRTRKTELPEWRILPPPPPEWSQQSGLPPLWNRLLYNRGITHPEGIPEFLDSGPSQLRDPFLLPGVAQAVPRILEAILAGETIAIYGDFDTDGVTATAVLTRTLFALGAKVVPYLPHRIREGHGLNVEALGWLKGQGVSLLITVDCGITAREEVHIALGMGIDTIITDHHRTVGPLPLAFAVVSAARNDPSYSTAPSLTGAGIAFKLAQALLAALGRPLDEELLALATLGTIADMAPLQGENRALVRGGLEALNRIRSPGLLALCAEARLQPGRLDAEAVGFVIAPRLNAPGRLDSPYSSLRLLTTTSSEEAQVLARELEQLNRQRQRLTTQHLLQVSSEAHRQATEQMLLFLSGEELAPGVIGLVAGKLAEQFHRPAVVVALDGDVAWGSGRSVAGFDIVEAFTRCQSHLQRFGGHTGAAGFMASRAVLPDLRRHLQAIAAEVLNEASLRSTVAIDAEVSPRDLLGDTFQFLQRMAPFGSGNPRPLFLTRGVQLLRVRQVGKGGQHLSLKVRHEGAVWDVMAFGRGNGPEQDEEQAVEQLPPVLDMVYTIGPDGLDRDGPPRISLVDYCPSVAGSAPG
ncbi:MAG: single-stranded-DNA-specific exonuclease RecJ [Chloroflexi bacterium]|nr:single-stranded-DNA-specific exonuclease RecJ [Chloroflexota bacterium]